MLRLLRSLSGVSLAFAALMLGCTSLQKDREAASSQAVVTFCPGSCPEKIALLFDAAKRSIDLTVYGIRNDIVAEALIRATKRNVEVTVIYDPSMYRNNQRDKRSKIDPLRAAGVRVLPFRGRDAFHHKTIILDGERVWTGSLNLKWMGRLHDNYLLIRDPSIVARYREWFALLQQNPTREALTRSNERLSQYGGDESLQAHFGPSSSFSEPLLRLIDEAESSLELAVNVLSYPPVVASLVAAQQRGVRVRALLGVFTDKTLRSYGKQQWAMKTLDAGGVEVWTIGLHHQKMMVVDGSIVLTGSPGFDTNPLTRNHDNYVIAESRSLASQFENRMAEMWADAKRYPVAGETSEAARPPSPLVIRPISTSEGKLRNPGDIIYYKGRWVAAEIYENRLAIFDDLQLSNLRYFDPESIGESMTAPHFLAISPWGSLLISNGWGDTIVEIRDLTGAGWKSFGGVGKPFNHPHGLCVDDEGWIYVGDSLNSRLVRFRDMEGRDWQVFADRERKISYIRELVCRDGEVWISNSYEAKPNLNPGQGANVLRLTDFESGHTHEVVAFDRTNITGIMHLPRNQLLVGLWGPFQRLALVDLVTGERSFLGPDHTSLGVPYGTFADPARRAWVVSYFGGFRDAKNPNFGGFVVLGERPARRGDEAEVGEP